MTGRLWRLLITVLALVIFTATPALSVPASEQRELWSGSILTTSYRVGLCIKASGEARGVLLLRSLWGDTDTYHLYGTVQNGQITLRHASGHRIDARYEGDRVKGKAFLRQGKRFTIDARKTGNAQLMPDDCRPLPE